MVRKYKRKKGVSITKAKKYTYNGIHYKSGLERTMGMLLTDANIDFKYEPKKFHLVDDFVFDRHSYERQANGKGDFIDRGFKKVQNIKYTPHFIGKGFIIETKGWANEEFRNKWKMFKKHIKDNKIQVALFKPQNKKECIETVKVIKNTIDNE